MAVYQHAKNLPFAAEVGGVPVAVDNPLFEPAVKAAREAGWHTWFNPSPARAKFDPVIGDMLETPTIIQDAYDPTVEYTFPDHAPSMVEGFPPRANFLDPSGQGGIANRSRFAAYDGTNPGWWLIFAAKLNALATNVPTGLLFHTTVDGSMGDGLRWDNTSGLRAYIGGTVMGSIGAESAPTAWQIYVLTMLTPTQFRAYRNTTQKLAVGTSGAHVIGNKLQVGGRGADGSIENLAGGANGTDIGWGWGGGGPGVFLTPTQRAAIVALFMSPEVYNVTGP